MQNWEDFLAVVSSKFGLSVDEQLELFYESEKELQEKVGQFML